MQVFQKFFRGPMSRGTQIRIPLIGELSSKMTEGCYSYSINVVPVRQHTLKPRTPPALWATSPHRGGLWVAGDS